ncbi:MAG: aldehyde ferredoxin oxidoreductase C-terminal domain-containing protein, partial [Desulfobacterales bacterium]|nr:aldehyde ferredoxin oxidoreductase C-terminal domain-containing protein [Desulfobacterales bacterium]MDX2511078.1 aldehyde ferredoxin oxidoreductase C-terminal domain-containing protein [Desulfobacterales bacterium]
VIYCKKIRCLRYLDHSKDAVVPLKALKDDYYKAMGFDLRTGNPPESLLEEVGIKANSKK